MWRIAMHRQKRTVDDDYHDWILWMNDEQKEELQKMLNSGVNHDEIYKKVDGYFSKLEKTEQARLTKDYRVMIMFIWIIIAKVGVDYTSN